MRISFFGNLNYDPIELSVSNIPQVLAGLRHNYGAELADILIQNNHYYVLGKSNNSEDYLAIHPQMIASDFGDYDLLFIVPDIGGDTGIEEAALLAAYTAGASVAAATAISYIVGAIVAVAISVALSYIAQLLSPTLKFDSDPSSAQGRKLESSLYNGAPNIREQGGSVPIIVGQTNAGGVLISAGISTEQLTA
jgi:predicted phage tail protein